MAEIAPQKVVMVGLDAGDIDFIRDHVAELPVLRELCDAELRPLHSPAELLTSAVWPSFNTGQGPGHHGIYYPMQWDPAQMTLRRVSADWLDYRPWWHELAQRGHKVTVLDAPFSHASRLPPDSPAVEVLNWGSQECLGPFHSNRPGLAAAIRRRFGRHPMGEDVPVQEPARRLARIRDRLVAGARRKGALARWLLDTTDPELFVTVFAEPHRGGHLLWPDFGGRPTGVPDGALLDVYRGVDAGLGELLGGVDRSTTAVVLFSTHGFRPNYTQEHFLLPVMERIGKLFRGEPLPQDGDGSDSGGGDSGGGDSGGGDSGGNLMQRLRAAVPQRLQFHIARLLPASVRDGVVRGAYLGGLDWNATPGFALIASGEGYLRFCTQGRERDATFAADSAELQRYRELLDRCLRGLRCGETGRPVVRDLVDAQARYPGPRAHYLPDRVVLWADVLPSTRLESDELGTIHATLTTGRVGEHRPDGFVARSGATGGLPGVERVEDLAQLAHVALRTGMRAAGTQATGATD